MRRGNGKHGATRRFPLTFACPATTCALRTERACQRDAAEQTNPPRPRFGDFPRDFPFHAGRFDTRAARRFRSESISRTAYCASSESHDIRKTRAFAARSPGPRHEGLQHADADPGAGHSRRARRARPDGHRPDRHRQDRRVHAPEHRPAARGARGRRRSSRAACWCWRRRANSPGRSPSRPRITARWPGSRCSRSSAAPRSARTATSCTTGPTFSSPRPAACST